MNEILKNREGFVVYKSWYEQLKNLSDSQIREVFTAMFEYQIYDNYEINDPVVEMAFGFIKQQFDSDRKKYISQVETNRTNGKKGGRPIKVSSKVEKPNGLHNNQTDNIKADKGKDKDMDKGKDLPEKISGDFIYQILEIFREEYIKYRGIEFDNITLGKERNAISKLLQLYRNNNPGNNTADTLEDFRTMFSELLQIQDTWHYEKMSPSHIVSNYNQLKNKLNGNNRQNSKVQLSELDRLINVHFKG